ncbi:hypothetical protein B0J18DRAFT_409560 [Chaetomium sp. MPI-SDFR-AT-0129]|nr:hypothetical protein B0J18DRAFT_409560 [Chaetomium sp. MPI-SDFR-AT-0129]
MKLSQHPLLLTAALLSVITPIVSDEITVWSCLPSSSSSTTAPSSSSTSSHHHHHHGCSPSDTPSSSLESSTSSESSTSLESSSSSESTSESTSEPASSSTTLVPSSTLTTSFAIPVPTTWGHVNASTIAWTFVWRRCAMPTPLSEV